MSAETIARVLTEREQYIYGLRALADLLEGDAELTLPSETQALAFPGGEREIGETSDLVDILRVFDLAEARGVEVKRYVQGGRECFEAVLPIAPGVSYKLYANRRTTKRTVYKRTVVTREQVQPS